ncbi:MAG: hypothetical protein HQK51_02675 [Oligoflexia bacterium]|nr:hypothetical protein [Oligoflexia bacterium]
MNTHNHKYIDISFFIAIFLIFSILHSQNTYSYELIKEYPSSFTVTVYDRYIKVVSAEKASEAVEVVTDNKTLSKLLAKVETEDKKTVFYLNIPSQSSKKINLNLANKNTKIIFTPLAPAFQEVKLVFGSKVYEVPARDTK